MPDTTCHMSISLDGFVAGPDQSREHPLGKGGREVHRWHLGDKRANEADETATGWLMRPRGAYVMGRNMFGPIRGEWEEDWRGWWGPEPPYHAPVFVLTHHAREPIEMEGGTTFHFITDGFDAAYARASRDGRRRRRGHRGRRLHRSAGARCRGRRRAHARHRPSPARVRRADLRRRRISRVRARRGAAFAAGHAHPLPPSELKAGFRDVYQAALRISRCGRPATHFGRPASASPSFGTSGNVDLDRLGRLVEPVVDRVLHARDVDSVIALSPAQRTELAQEIWRAAERAGGDVQTSGAAVEAAGRSERLRLHPATATLASIAGGLPVPGLCGYRFGRDVPALARKVG